MLFTYRHIDHPIRNMHGYIDYIFLDVWCQAKQHSYGLGLFEGCPDLLNIVMELTQKEQMGRPLEGAAFFIQGLRQIFDQFKMLSEVEIEEIRCWYVANNDIKRCCENDPRAQPIRYTQLAARFQMLSSHFEAFFKKLYDHSFLSLKIIKDHIGSIADHYEKFVQENDEDICPFCGLMPLDSQWSETRDAYDHYLPKAKYPFNSINFDNLPPACHSCNSKNKLAKDPLQDRQSSRKAFYPFSLSHPKMHFCMTVTPEDWPHYTPGDITLQIGPEQYAEEISSWVDVYSIDGRYKDFMCRKNFGRHWLEQARAWVTRGGRLEDYFDQLVESEGRAPYADFNFLKKPFLEACRVSGVFEALEGEEGGAEPFEDFGEK